MKKKESNIKIIAKNKKAFFEYEILEKFEAGIVLQGSEVKSLRDGKASLSDAYAMITSGQASLLHAHIQQYSAASIFNHEPKRARRLLLHKQEIAKLASKLAERGLTLVPTMLYFKEGRAKVELGLARGKKKYDKRASIKKREGDREMKRAMVRR